MHGFLTRHRAELIERCVTKVAQRPFHTATPEQLRNGVPIFLDQLTRTLDAERGGRSAESLRISGPAGGGITSAASEIGVSATSHGKQLLDLGYSVDQVVHCYGDLCQAITDLAVEKDAPFQVDEFRTLNRCLDTAIAEAVTAFSIERDSIALQRHSDEANERLGFLLHELRNSLNTATLAMLALETGRLPIAGATGGVLKRSLLALTSLVKHALVEVRVAAASTDPNVFTLGQFIADAGAAAVLDANARGCSLVIRNTLDPAIEVHGDRELLLGAAMNLLQNAFKFTQPGTEVSLTVLESGNDDLRIEVEDRCGGLGAGAAEVIFKPFIRRHEDKTGLGLGLAIARQNVEAAGGSLGVRNLPGIGCVFTITLHRQVPLAVH